MCFVHKVVCNVFSHGLYVFQHCIFIGSEGYFQLYFRRAQSNHLNSFNILSTLSLGISIVLQDQI